MAHYRLKRVLAAVTATVAATATVIGCAAVTASVCAQYSECVRDSECGCFRAAAASTAASVVVRGAFDEVGAVAYFELRANTRTRARAQTTAQTMVR